MITTTLRRILVSVSSVAGLLAAIALPASAQGQGKALGLDHAAVKAVIAVQDEVTPGLMTDSAVLGTAVGVDEEDPVLVVYVDRNHKGVNETIKSLPIQIRGKLVKVEATDKFKAYAGKPEGGNAPVSHTAVQTAPIQLGTSGGWRLDLANGYCCGGTLGSLIRVSGATDVNDNGLYVLSNYHVFESDTNAGADGVIARTGDPVIQPGLIDVNCTAAKAQDVATLRKISSLPNSNVDCSIAKIIPGQVSSSGSILEIGTISSGTAAASVGQAVKKSGRTTGLTRSTVSGLNATIKVTYDNECAGVNVFTKTFTGQIVISNNGSRFLNSGDSGSLMVEDKGTNPKAVGLLYAGGGNTAIANPIGQVLSYITSQLGGSAAMVGN